MSPWGKYEPVLVLLVFAVSLFAVPAIIDGVRTYRRGREIARQVKQHLEAKEFLQAQWPEQQERRRA